MKLCYADPELKVSKEEFERPANLYKVDCYSVCQEKTLQLFRITGILNFKNVLCPAIRYSCLVETHP
jgi:hypothetical protein